MHLNWLLVTSLIVLLSIGLTTRTVDAAKKSKEENEEEESRSTDTDTDSDSDSDSDDDDDDDKKVVFIPREKASIFLSYNECVRRMNCGSSRKEECSEECAVGNTEEEMEEYTEIFEHIEEYRSDSKLSTKKNSKKQQESSSDSDEDDDDNDDDSDDDSTASDDESDASSEDEDEPPAKNKKVQSSSSVPSKKSTTSSSKKNWISTNTLRESATSVIFPDPCLKSRSSPLLG